MGAAPGVEYAASMGRFQDARDVLENDPDLRLPDFARGGEPNLANTLMSKATAVARKASSRSPRRISPKRSKRIKRFESKRQDEDDNVPAIVKRASSRSPRKKNAKVPSTSPRVRRASMSSARRKSFKNTTSDDDDDGHASSKIDKELPAKPKMPHHLKTPASMKKGFFGGRRGSLEDFSKSLQLFKSESAVFHKARIEQAHATLNRNKFKHQNIEKRLHHAVDAFEDMRKKAKESGDFDDSTAKSRWKNVAKRVTRKQAVERTKNRLKKMNSFWDKEASKWEMFKSDDDDSSDDQNGN